ncbi:phosphoribosylanthranilate isomerase [Chitinophaga skermanii]|uniref:N-(5'-phosphoribosyl)anthranilate isomerase n=1 Tax=Chitinophaga skermanii TaxID=331697 RepID=A0A327QDC2_9BACT|nr:phosphoribosylanthranilate isomerase [Chitinophaga skermanii]RAJ02656.1 phosphoribosylanthranilate isomerase [Chitinophaga skermanii]
MKIKVCGITREADLQALVAAGADYAGFIFYEKSPRFVGGKLAADVVKSVGAGIQKVGVFVNAESNTVQQAIKNYGLDAVQLHGDEGVTFCQNIRLQVPVIKAFRVGDGSTFLHDAAPFLPVVDYFLFDTAHKGAYGGTGEQFNWEVLQQFTLDKPFFLSGGIGEADVKTLAKFRHPQLFAVDVNSKFETAPGEKDMVRVAKFIQAIKTQNI